ncbi:MAG: pantetheine-phosphate adenylyltransferase [Flavobacteriaceae bacterium]|nr:pantetheine-phosphate adenylyltransferase [Flavobacteriaceae bacterium]
MRKAIFPGTFDPLTLGHFDILKRSLPLFDEIVVGIGNNIEKKTMFSIAERISFIEKCFIDEPKISVKSYYGLTIDFCKEINANFILRGIRNNGDFEFEKAIARTNRKLSKIETVFLLTSANTSFISSSIVRDLIINKGDYHLLVPNSVKVD